MAAPSLNVYYGGVGVIPADQLNTYVQTCTNFAQLRTFSGLSNMCVFVLGGASPSDGLQGSFYWNSTITNPTDDGVDTIVPTGSVKGAWLRVFAALSPTSSLGTMTATGAYVPPSNLLFADIELLGDGGAGGGAIGPTSPSTPPASPLGASGGGGGGGAYIRKRFSAAILAAAAPITVTLGTGGLGGVGIDGAAGTGSSFGSLLSVGGGQGGLSDTNHSYGGAGGNATPVVASFSFPGYWGQDGVNSGSAGIPPIGGAGAGSFFGGSSQAQVAGDGHSIPGQNARHFGSGGGGASILNVNTSEPGGNGSQGVCVITQYVQL